MDAHVVPDQHDRAAELGAGTQDQIPEVAPSEALRLVLTPVVLADRVDQTGTLAALVAGHARHRDPAGASSTNPHHRGLARPQVFPRGGVIDCPASSSKTTQAPDAAAAVYLRPDLLLPQHNRVLVSLDRPAGGLLPAPAAPLEQQPGALHRVRDAGQAPDQGLDPSERPPLIRPAVRQRSPLQLTLQALHLGPAPTSAAPASPSTARRFAPFSPGSPPRSTDRSETCNAAATVRNLTAIDRGQEEGQIHSL